MDELSEWALFDWDISGQIYKPDIVIESFHPEDFHRCELITFEELNRIYVLCSGCPELVIAGNNLLKAQTPGYDGEVSLRIREEQYGHALCYCEQKIIEKYNGDHLEMDYILEEFSNIDSIQFSTHCSSDKLEEFSNIEPIQFSTPCSADKFSRLRTLVRNLQFKKFEPIQFSTPCSSDKFSRLRTLVRNLRFKKFEPSVDRCSP
jgi:hypothetical protein